MKKLSVFLIFLLIFVLSALFVFNLWFRKKNLEEAKIALLAGDFKKAQSQAVSSLHSFQRTKIFLSVLPFSGNFSQIRELTEIGEGLGKIALHLANTGELIEKIFGVVLGREVGDLEEIVKEAKMEVDLVWRDFSLIESAFKKRPIIELPDMRKKIEIGREFFSIIPEVFGASQKKSYLFLFQNNMELRATGGFIGSYGLAIFENGKLLDFQVEDVYTADGQLKGHVEPPAPIIKYLGEAGWYLRDSNFDPDFPKTAERVKWFFQKETGRVVDGVIGVNLFVVQKILRAIGSVKLPDYQEVITADNLFERGEYYSEVGSFPGSTQKGDFLGTLASEIFQRFNQTDNWLEIGEALFNSLEEKQILISLDDKKAAKVINHYHWDGEIMPNTKYQIPNTKYIPDYLMVVESNFGVNKSNYFIDRKLNHKIEIKEGIEEELVIHYQNNSPIHVWPGGDYKNYLRIYVPLKSQLLGVKIDEKPLDLREIDVFSSSEKSVFGFLVKVPVGEEREVKVRYKIPFKLEDFTAYALFFQKQSGTKGDPLSVLVDYPSSLKVVKIAPDALTGQYVLLYNTELSKDRLFIFEYIQ